MLRKFVVLCAVAAVTASCSKSSTERSSALPTSPSAIVLPEQDGSGVSRKAVVSFPGRTDTLDFRMQLESKYATGLGRTPAQTYVDAEGEAAWITEYDRYRVNGCDHDTAVRNVMAQIDGAAPPQVCAVRFFPETAIYPGRDQLTDFRRQLGNKYQSMGRSAQSAVDGDGAAIWTGEYLRYRTSGCDHPTAVGKTLPQVDGAPASATCLAQCAYYVSPATVATPSGGGAFSVDLIRTSGTCEWLAVSEAPWVALTPPITGGDRSRLSFLVAPNSGGPRSGTVRVNYPGGVAFFEVTQAALSYTLGFQFFDPAVSSNPTTECQIRTTSSVCTLTAVATGLPAAVATYDWQVEYTYGGAKLKTQSGSLPTYLLTESCAASSTGAATVPISVRLTVTDTLGNSATLYSGQGSQPALQLKTTPCP
jgi:hypothetical protein